jgi:hypothetical protein
MDNARADAQDAWGRKLLDALAAAGREAEELHLFSSPEAVHVALIQTAIVNLMCCCDLPGDEALVADLVQQAQAGAARNMRNVAAVH